MVGASDIKNGLTIKYNNDLYKIVEFLHVKPGKGPAFVRTKMKSLTNGRVIDNTFTNSSKLDDVRIERRTFQYLYKDSMGYNFMNTETYDQLPLPEDILENTDLFKEGMEVDVIFHAEEDLALSCELPSFIVLEVTYTEPGLKGDTASSSASKFATLETGAQIKVPLFIETGTKIKIDTRSRSYVERAK